jgi:hypothetical protein
MRRLDLVHSSSCSTKNKVMHQSRTLEFGVCPGEAPLGGIRFGNIFFDFDLDTIKTFAAHIIMDKGDC